METLGYTKKLCILPFDHRSYFEELLGYPEPLTDTQKAELSDYKKVVYEGYEKSLAEGLSKDDTAVLIDDVFGLALLLDAETKGYTTLQSTEISGIDHFEFEHGDDWQTWIEKVQPTFAKVLLRYNVGGNQELNQKSLVNLKKVSDYTKERGYKFLIELLVPPTDEELAFVEGNKARYDHELRPDLTIRAIREMQNAGVEPDVWKIEGMYKETDYKNVVDTAREGNRSNVSIVSLGRNERDEVVEEWLKVGSRVSGVIGFAVGRTVFLDALLKYRSKEYTREQAAAKVAERFIHFYNAFNGR